MAVQAVPDGSGQTDSPPQSRRSGWDVLLIAVALAALITLTIYVVHHYANDSTNAATILGIVVPAFATIGAAAFGITVAYGAGKTEGEARGAAGKDAAVKQAQTDVANRISGPLQEARETVANLVSTIEQHASSPAGERAIVLGPEPGAQPRAGAAPEAQAEPLVLDPEPLHDARTQLERLQGAVDTLREPDQGQG